MAKRSVNKRVLVPRTRNAGTMTEAEYFNRIRSLLRKGFQHWEPMKKALKAAQRKSQNTLNKRLKYEYQCADCGGWFPASEIQIDHVVPCGSLRNLQDVVEFIERLTAEDPAAFQVLCTKDCHKAKTRYEALDWANAKSVQS